MRSSEVVGAALDDEVAWRCEGVQRIRQRVQQAQQLKVQIAAIATQVRRTGVRTAAQAEAMSYLMFRLHETIFMARLMQGVLATRNSGGCHIRSRQRNMGKDSGA